MDVLHVEFKQNNPQTTLTPLNFDLEKVGIYQNLVVLLQKMLYFRIFRHEPKLAHCSFD